MTDLKRNHMLRTILSTAVLAGTLAAQNPGTPPTLQSLNFERVLDARQVLTTLTPNIPPVVVAGLLAGTLELRESMNFNPVNGVLSINAFTVQTSAPIPTPSNGFTPFSVASMNVDKIYSSLSPRPGVMLIGTMASNSPVSPYGNLTGAAASLAIGYTADTPAKITNVVLTIAGSAVEYSGAGEGTLTFVQPATAPPTSASPQIVVSSPTSVYQKIADLDASMTTSPNLPLTFLWAPVTGNSDIAHATSAKALAYLNGGFGAYTFKLTVTDAKGNIATQTVTINLY